MKDYQEVSQAVPVAFLSLPREQHTSKDWYKMYLEPLLCAKFKSALSAGTKAS